MRQIPLIEVTDTIELPPFLSQRILTRLVERAYMEGEQLVFPETRFTVRVVEGGEE